MIEAAPPPDFLWLQRRTGCALTSDFNAIRATNALGHVLGMVGFCDWTENSVQAHMAVDAPVVWRELLPAAFRYAFEERGRGILLGVIPSHNLRSIRFAKHVGLVETFRIKDGWSSGDDLVLLEMRRENCRWLTGQRKAA